MPDVVDAPGVEFEDYEGEEGGGDEEDEVYSEEGEHC